MVTRRYSHILVKDETTARALRDSLSHGVPFADLARRHSIDEQAGKGGDLGWAAVGSYVDEFEAAALPLKAGGIGGPVHTKFGWHLITSTGERSDTLKSKEMAQAVADARERQRRMKAVQGYVESLKHKYHVTVNDSLLHALDFGSDDPAVEKALEANESALAVLPTRRLTVRGLARNIRFQYYHGLAGRPDAADIRDRQFDDWLTEMLLSDEEHVLGRDRAPELVRKAKHEERRLVREEVIKDIVNFKFQADSSAIGVYYRTHRKDFSSPPRIKVKSVFIEKEADARQFREELKQGAGLKWLATQHPEIPDDPPYPTDWMDTDQLDLGGRPPVEGAILGPTPLRGGFAIAEITAVEETATRPLQECRDEVVRALRSERTHQEIEDALSRLQKATKVAVADGARDKVEARLAQLRAAAAEGGPH